MSNYILKGRTPELCEDVVEWARWYDKADRRVADWQGTVNGQDVRVSTVFLGIDHDFSKDGPPILFETMVFGGERDQEQERYATWEEAEDGHAKFVSLMKRD
jgi:hypothetical protein